MFFPEKNVQLTSKLLQLKGCWACWNHKIERENSSQSVDNVFIAVCCFRRSLEILKFETFELNLSIVVWLLE